MSRASTSGEPKDEGGKSATPQEDGDIISHDMEPRTSYLIEEPKPDTSFSIFNSELVAGKHGLCITRKNPKHLREKFNWTDVPIIWLTNNNIENERCIDPTNLSRLTNEMVDFIKKTEKGIVLLEGLEYLISQNSYQIILRFIQLINDKIMLSSNSFVVPLDPLILSERELHLLKRDMKLLSK